ncbi:MAG: hypothetical protein AAF222_02455 [Pseudomonadota bacterium]
MAWFRKKGAKVYAADLTPKGSLDQIDDDCSHFVKLDVTHEADAMAAMDRVRSADGKLGILVNVARIEKTIKKPPSMNGTRALQLMPQARS